MQPGQLSQLGSTISAQPERNQLILLNASKHSYRSKHRKHTVLKQLDSCIQKRRHYLWLLVLASCKNSLRITIPGQQGILKPFDHHRCCLSLSPSTKQKTRTSNFYSAPLVFYFYFRFSWAGHHEFLTHTHFSHFSASKCAAQQWFLRCTSVEECRVFKSLILWVVPELSSRFPSWLPVLAARQDRSTCAPCTLFCAAQCILLYTVHQSTILCRLCCAPCIVVHHCWPALFCICAAHCFVPCIDPSFAPCTIHAVHKWCCQQLKLRWSSSIANGRRRLHKATRPRMVAPSPLVSNQLEF